jgi:anti-sigma regulatory factor (Ser/Thr protein kinase)
MSERLVPKPHMIKSIRSRNWNLAGAIEELVDNSLGHGKATEVVVFIDNTEGIVVMDDGIGVDDINRVFRLGDASSHDVLTEIGQYGVGAKHATIYLGDEVTVTTIRDKHQHRMTVDWAKVERSGEWPLAYHGQGKLAKSREKGTRVIIRELARRYHLTTSEALARDLGQVFSPALRRGVEISVHHYLGTGGHQVLEVEPFQPKDLTDRIEISGRIETARGPLRWNGTAGLSESLTENYNGVHIAFGHRVIERTREPFAGESAPTLYCEIYLDDRTPWKHALSEHKDKVIRHRKELIASIHAEISELLKRASQQASYLALKVMTAPIEVQLTRALKGAGILHVDPDEESAPGEGNGHGQQGKPNRTRTPIDDGDTAKEAKRPTGVQIDWRTKEQLGGKLWSWEITGRRMLILLDREQFEPTIGYPPKLREQHVVQLVASILSHAIEAEYRQDISALMGALTPKLYQQVKEWAENHNMIAPYLNRTILESVG